MNKINLIIHRKGTIKKTIIFYQIEEGKRMYKQGYIIYIYIDKYKDKLIFIEKNCINFNNLII